MDTLTQDEIFAAYRATVITAERAMALLTGYKDPAATLVREAQLVAIIKKSHKKMPPAFSQKKWTSADIEHLKKLRESETPFKKCAKTLGRSTVACIMQHGRIARGWRKGGSNNNKGGMLL